MTRTWPHHLAACLATALTVSAQQNAGADTDSWMNCFAVIAGKDCTVDGSVIVAHNEDSGNNAAVHHWKVAAGEDAAGEAHELLAGGAVPYASETLGYVWCQMPGLMFSDTYFNEVCRYSQSPG